MKRILSTLGIIICLLNVGQLHAQRAKSKNIQFKSRLPFGSSGSDLSNIGGYVDSQGNEYALVGWEQGLKIVNVTNPTNPVTTKNIAGNTSLWREVKTSGNYAYVTTEGGGGLQIINLSSLPDANSIQVKQWEPTYQNTVLSTIHALHIDRNFLYLYGSNIGNKGALVCDITDPWNPTIVGFYDDTYVHDGFVLNDTLYACHIYDGYFTMVDMSNKANPVVLAQQSTPKNSTHNSWLTDDHKTLLTTDEIDGSFVVAYDVTDPGNIHEIDRVYSQNAGSNSVGHNVHVLNDYVVTSWYKDGVVIIDAHKPDNLVVVGWYDTSPLSGGGFNGAWGVYPFLPSQNLVVSDISEGLFVLTPTYKRACYLEGSVIDSACMEPLLGAKIKIIGADTVVETTDINGIFKMGTPDPGNYLVEISKPGYPTKFYNVVLAPGQVVNLNVSLSSPNSFNLNGLITNDNGNPIGGALVTLTSTTNTYTINANNLGEFDKCGVIEDNYNFVFGKWGYITECRNISLNQNVNFVSETLNTGYYDDFSFDFNWTVNSTASTGEWVLDVPIGTTLQGFPFSNPNTDINNDCGNKAFVTGNSDGSVGDDDVDDGYTDLISPVMNLSSYNDPYINYYRWFVNGGGNSPGNDSMIIYVGNGSTYKVVEKISRNNPNAGTWVYGSFRVKNYFSNLNSIQLKIHVEDYSPGHIVEGGFDKLVVSDNFSTASFLANEDQNGRVIMYPNPFSDHITITTIGLENPSTYVITDVSGQVVANGVIQKDALTLNTSLAPGVYFVRVFSGDEVYVSKICKN